MTYDGPCTRRRRRRHPDKLRDHPGPRLGRRTRKGRAGRFRDSHRPHRQAPRHRRRLAGRDRRALRRLPLPAAAADGPADRSPDVTERPKVQLRMLNHWDNMDGSIERGYAGRSLWQWNELPGTLSPRYVDYARANASIGINCTVINSVNANVLILTPDYLAKVAALAGLWRPYGLRVYLSANFAAPMRLGGLKTADPLDPGVAAWWKAKVGGNLQADSRLRRLSRQGQLGRAAGPERLRPQSRRGRQLPGRRRRAARRQRDLARVHLRRGRRSRSRQARVHRVHEARRPVPAERARAGEKRRHRLHAARTVPSALRRA